MKKLNNYLLAVAAGITLFTACAPDNSTTSSDDRDKFAGSWTCIDSGSVSGKSTYGVTVEKAGGDTIHIKNFYALGNSTYANALVSGNSVVIFSQTDDLVVISGSGTFSNNKFSISYTAKLGSSNDNGEAKYQ